MADWRSFTDPLLSIGQAPVQAWTGVKRQLTWWQPFFQVYKFDKWLAVFIIYKRKCWLFQSHICHCCSYALAISSWPLALTLACPSPGPCFFLQLLKPCLCFSALAWLLLVAFIIAPFCSAMTLVDLVSAVCQPCLADGTAPEHCLPHVLP